ncbi:MAG: hypothetical protein ACXWZY_10105, partial [Gaiellaceae bacterium]
MQTRARPFVIALAAAALAACGPLAAADDAASDAPERQGHVAVFQDAESYPAALRVWRTPEDVNAWIGAKFRYDTPRAILLAESQRGQGGEVRIHAPDRFFAAPFGVCVDLARFTVETLRRISPGLEPKYLMVEFSPMTLAGQTLRRHWLASFTRDGKRYVFGDSKRPGHIAGPYDSAEEFIVEYAAYRKRTIVAVD